jgi:pseudouridine synthase
LDTSGLLVMTNDSAFAETLTNPECRVAKTYLVKASKRLTDVELDRLRAGVMLRDGKTRPALVTREPHGGGGSVFEITITEGRNRQVRRMVEALGAKVVKLVRVAIGGVRIGEPGRRGEAAPRRGGQAADLAALVRHGQRHGDDDLLVLTRVSGARRVRDEIEAGRHVAQWPRSVRLAFAATGRVTQPRA